MTKKFRERNLTVIAIAAVVGLLAAIAGSFQLAELPGIAGTSYGARFAEAGGLKTGDAVRVAGVTVGKVNTVELDRNTVLVEFTAKDIELGESTTAQIKTGTLLGSRFLNLVPRGDGAMSSGAEIPLDRTKAPYTLTDSLSAVAGHSRKLDLDLIGDALRTFSDTFRDTADDLAPAFSGITELSRTISSRDKALRTLFKRAENVTGTFRQRTQQITTLIRDGNLILAELQARRHSIERLIVNTTAVADQVSAMVEENKGQLRPALNELNKVLKLLRRNEGNIVATVDRAASFITGLGEGVAHGPWFTGHLNLPPGMAATPGLVNGGK